MKIILCFCPIHVSFVWILTEKSRKCLLCKSRASFAIRLTGATWAKTISGMYVGTNIWTVRLYIESYTEYTYVQNTRYQKVPTQIHLSTQEHQCIQWYTIKYPPTRKYQTHVSIFWNEHQYISVHLRCFSKAIQRKRIQPMIHMVNILEKLDPNILHLFTFQRSPENFVQTQT